MTAPRTYCIGLPVFVTVHDDGTVTYDIDVAEADHAPCEYEPEYQEMLDEAGQPMVLTEEILDADTERIEAAICAGTWVRTPLGTTD